jgi:hypothetical protein
MTDSLDDSLHNRAIDINGDMRRNITGKRNNLTPTPLLEERGLNPKVEKS